MIAILPSGTHQDQARALVFFASPACSIFGLTATLDASRRKSRGIDYGLGHENHRSALCAERRDLDRSARESGEFRQLIVRISRTASNAATAGLSLIASAKFPDVDRLALIDRLIATGHDVTSILFVVHNPDDESRVLGPRDLANRLSTHGSGAVLLETSTSLQGLD